MHLVDQARAHIAARHVRPLFARTARALLASVLPHPGRFRAAMQLVRLARPLRWLLPGRLKAMVDVVPKSMKRRPSRQGEVRSLAPEGTRRRRVALSHGCVQQIAGAHINLAAERLLRRLGCEVVVAEGKACCGALTHHLGKTRVALEYVTANVAAWSAELEGNGLDAIVTTASGCGTMVKDYGYLLNDDPEYARPARRVAGIARDITEVVADLGLPEIKDPPALRVAYQDACSLVHGQRVHEEPRNLLRSAGFDVVEVPDGHLCCGSAGTYNVLQPALGERLRALKMANIKSVDPDVIAVGNIGCMNQMSARPGTPVVHTVELLDWATGGPRPPAFQPD
jgi:glycolate oxidase iron-sulfur subunit